MPIISTFFLLLSAISMAKMYDLKLDGRLSAWHSIPIVEHQKLALHGLFIPLFGSITSDDEYSDYRNEIFYTRDWNIFYLRISDCLSDFGWSDPDDTPLIQGVSFCDEHTLENQLASEHITPSPVLPEIVLRLERLLIVEKSEWLDEWVDEQTEDAKDWLDERAEDSEDWVSDRAEDSEDWVDERVEDADDWADERVDDASDWVDERADDAGDWLDRRGEDLKKVEDNIKRGFKKLFD